MKNRCPICGGDRLRLFLSRSAMPVHQNLLVGSREEALAVPRGDLEMAICADCGFVFNRAFDPTLMRYGPHYDNVQSHSPYFERYVDRLIDELVECRGVRNASIVEVGCGKGDFLRKLVAHPGANNIGHGFDPSYEGPLSDVDGRLLFHRRFYDRDCADVRADVVVCRHVIEHCQEPMELLTSVRAALESSSDARAFFETPSVEWILGNVVIWDFFYEHCSLFSAGTLANAFRRAGFAIERVERIFGGQYLWAEAKVGSTEAIIPSDGRDAAELVRLAGIFAEKEKRQLERWLDLLRKAKLDGPVALWGAGAKGTTLANLIDQDCSLIDCLVDVNPSKQGRFVPGTGHPIVAPTELAVREVRHAVVMNPNYRAEITGMLARLDCDVKLIEDDEA